MTFPGYAFNADEMKKLANDGIEKKTIDWGIASAKRLASFIQIGYPRFVSGNLRDKTDRFYNSVSLISPDGDILYTYDKHFLFSADELWATAGEGFKSFDCNPFGRIGSGICMDINPYKFEAPFDAFEFANFHVLEKTRFIFLSMAWLKSAEHTPFSLIYYWIQRLEPFLSASKNTNVPIIVVISNRNGIEGETTYAGSSCILRFSQGRVKIMDHLNTEDESLLFVDFNDEKLC